MKVLLYLDHAPDYREEFLRSLSEKCELIVVAQSCKKDNLFPPKNRKGYKYIELSKVYGNKIRFNFELGKIIKKLSPDVICIALNLRHPIRIIDFIRYKKRKQKWIWWGQIFGRNDNSLVVKLKKKLIRKSAGCLVYTEEIKERLNLKNVKSFDNSQFSEMDYTKLANNFNSQKLNCLFVGRPQERKRLNLLIDFASTFDFLNIRLVGPKMDAYFKEVSLPPNVQLYGAAKDKELENHFKWSNIVVNPGHVGLLVMNAACHNRPIVIDSKVNHAPEFILAKQADQYFIDFTDKEEVKMFFSQCFKNQKNLISVGERLFTIAKKEYTVESMAKKHWEMFSTIKN